MSVLIKSSRSLKAVQMKAGPSVSQMCQQQLISVPVRFITPQPAREQPSHGRWKWCLMRNCQRVTRDWCISWWVRRVKETWRKCESSWFLVTLRQHLCNVLQNCDEEWVLLWNDMALVHFALWNYLGSWWKENVFVFDRICICHILSEPGDPLCPVTMSRT